MPVYEYRCPTCDSCFNRLVRRPGAEPDGACPCPRCGADAARMLSAFSYHRSLQMQIDSIDPRIEQEMDAVDSMRGRDPLTRLGLDGGTG